MVHYARRLLLCPLGVLCSIGWYCFNRSFGHRKINQPVLPVISIGNLTLGGSGKTGVTISLARYLKKIGLKVAVVIRGWGSRQEQRDNPSFVSNRTSVLEVGDEAKLLKRCLPQATIVACRNRARAIREIADKTDSQIVILDDILDDTLNDMANITSSDIILLYFPGRSSGKFVLKS